MDAEELRQLFLEEATESLAQLETGLLQLERTPTDPEAIDLIFRIAHSLKGGSAMMRFAEITHFTHALESLLDQLRRGARAVTPAVVDALLASADVLRGLVARVAAGTEAMSADEGAERVRAVITAILESTDTPAPGAEPALYRIDFRPSRDVLLRGLDPLRLLAQLAELGEVREVVPDLTALPPLSQIESERCYLAWTVTLATTRPQGAIDECLGFAAGPDGLRITRISTAPTARATEEPPRLRRTDRDEATVIRVAVEKVDRLVDLVGELVTTQSMLAQAVADLAPAGAARLQEAVAQMERHARELHERILAVRMVSVRTLFARLPRVVRDLAAASNKEVCIELAGEDTELDKNVIERIADPLLHLVRNAVDHGLESAEARRAAGKPEAGRLRLEASQRGGNVYIDVSDDGRGLDRERIVARARRQGLIGAGESPSDEDAFALIFRPGFSTAETVTDVSGRGVGMDVVKRGVVALGGSVSISTEPGQGTRFRIQLPLTLALLDGQVLMVGDQTYVVPLMAITESLRPARGSVHAIEGAGEVVLVRGTSAPLLRLYRHFDVAAATADPYEGLVVVVEHEERRIALLVDRLLGQQQVVIKSLETHFQKVDAVSGATILGDGRVALILDVPRLIALTRTMRPSAAAGATRQAARVVEAAN